MVLGKLYSYTQEKKNNPLSHTIHKISSKWIKELNIRPEAIKLLEENIGHTFFDICLSNVFLGMSPQAKETKAEINKGTTPN